MMTAALLMHVMMVALTSPPVRSGPGPIAVYDGMYSPAFVAGLTAELRAVLDADMARGKESEDPKIREGSTKVSGATSWNERKLSCIAKRIERAFNGIPTPPPASQLCGKTPSVCQPAICAAPQS